MKKSVWLLATVLLFICSWSLAYGETADGQTPAEESVCDMAGYTGALWGLCNAYCEAMDCDSKAVNAANEACDRVLDNFISKGGGKGLPCEKFGKTCKKTCSIAYREDQGTCEKQYLIALKACGKDLSCIRDADLTRTQCLDDADVGYDLCLAECVGNDCAAECYELHLRADDKCYNKFCNASDCDLKVLNACLGNNDDAEEKCLLECKIIVK